MIPIIMCTLGLFMAACPKAATKKDKRDDPSAVQKVRTAGIVNLVCGILIIGMQLLFHSFN